MKKASTVLLSLFLAAAFTASTASAHSDVKKTAAHKHKDCKECCCDMKKEDSAKKSASKETGAKKDEAKKSPETK